MISLFPVVVRNMSPIFAASFIGITLIAVHRASSALYRIYLCNDHISSKTFCAHGSALAAPSVACNDHVLACHQQVRCPHDPVP